MMAATMDDMERLREMLPPPTKLDELEDAIAVYFGDQDSVGTCKDIFEAERRLAAAADAAMRRSP